MPARLASQLVDTAPADLLALLADIQRRRYGDDWPYGTEVILWHEALAGENEDGRRLLQLATLAEGWYYWSDELQRMQWATLATWKRWMRLGWRR